MRSLDVVVVVEIVRSQEIKCHQVVNFVSLPMVTKTTATAREGELQIAFGLLLALVNGQTVEGESEGQRIRIGNAAAAAAAY